MRSLEAENQRPRLGRFFLLIDELDRVVGGDVVHPALGGRVLAIHNEGAIRILTMSLVGGMVIEARALALTAHVPLAHVGRGVAGSAHESGVGDIFDGEWP